MADNNKPVLIGPAYLLAVVQLRKYKLSVIFLAIKIIYQ